MGVVRKRDAGMVFYVCLLLGWMEMAIKEKVLSLNGDRSAWEGSVALKR
jgi:hypothetical protein